MRLARAFLATAFLLAQAAAYDEREVIAAAGLLSNHEPLEELAAIRNAGIECCAYGEPRGAAAGESGGARAVAKIMDLRPSVFDVNKSEFAINDSIVVAVFAQGIVKKPALPSPEDCRTERRLEEVNATLAVSAKNGGAVAASSEFRKRFTPGVEWRDFENFNIAWPPRGRTDVRIELPAEGGRHEYVVEANYSLQPVFSVRHWRLVRHVFCGGWACTSAWVCEYYGEERISIPASAVYSVNAVRYAFGARAHAVEASENGRKFLRAAAVFETPFDSLEVSKENAFYRRNRFAYPLSLEEEPYNFTRVNAVPAFSQASSGGAKNAWANESGGGADLPAGGRVNVTVRTPFSKKVFELLPDAEPALLLNLSLSKKTAKEGQRIEAVTRVSGGGGAPAGGVVVNFAFRSREWQRQATAVANESGVAVAGFEMPAGNVVAAAEARGRASSAFAQEFIVVENAAENNLLDYALALAGAAACVGGLLAAVGARLEAKSLLWKSARIAALLAVAYVVFLVVAGA